MASQSEEIKTKNFTYHVTHQPGCRLKLEIEASPATAGSEHGRAVKAVNKEISLPGFRKGKAPESFVLAQFPKQVEKEWHNLLLNNAFREFVEQTKLYPFRTVEKSLLRAQVSSCTSEQGAKMQIEYEITPQLPTVDFNAINIQSPKRDDVTQQDIDDVIRQIQLRYGEWTPVTERALQEGDFVDLDIVAVEEPPRSICENTRFEIHHGRTGEWLRKLILGKKAGETVEGMSEREKDFEGEFVPTLCRVTLKSIFESKPHPIDEELIKKVGLKETSELRTRVEQDLNKQADEAVADEMRSQVEREILRLFPFDIPLSLVNEEKKPLLEERVRRLSETGVAPEKMAEQAEALKGSVEEDIRRSYRLFFLTRSIADKNNIAVSEMEVLQELYGQLRNPQGSYFSSGMSQDEMRSRATVNVLSRKVLDYCIAQAKKD